METGGRKDAQDFRETLYTIGKDGSRRWVYKQHIDGFFNRARAITAVILLILYLSLPWVVVKGEQALRIDIPGRELIAFGRTFWASDSFFLVIILGGLGVSLFFFTSILGRVWCGWACPQTVFLEFVFRPIERWLEGPPTNRRRLDQESWSLRKLRIKGLKWLIYGFIAWFMASTALAYFVGRTNLINMISSPPTENWGLFMLTMALTGVLLFEFGWFREQFCTVLCPYARFQSVLLDNNSLVVGYDVQRGEPRGKPKANNGDCVDCGLCVKVCPTGIDIRNGLQLECLHCAACIDACDSVMKKLGRQIGLIRYDSLAGFEGQKRRFLRPRVIIYGIILIGYFALLSYTLVTRDLTDAILVRQTGTNPYTILSDGSITNHLTAHLTNKSDKEVTFSFLSSSDKVRLIVPVSPFPVAPKSIIKAPVFANFPSNLLEGGKIGLKVRIENSQGETKVQEFTLLGPG